MSLKFARLLNSEEEVYNFLIGPLGLDASLTQDIIPKIITCEKGVLDGIINPTSTSTKYRVMLHQTDIARQKLRNDIVNELFLKTMYKDDNKISLGKGGARPKEVKKNRKAFILIGLPASGKSTVASTIAQKYGAIILDSDFAKRKLPEYYNYPWGASLVNAESSWITFGNSSIPEFESLFTKSLSEGFNVVIPKIGSNPQDIIPFCESLKQLKYTVHLTLVYLPKEKATLRALKRYLSSNRYVPLSVIFDSFSNNPALTYFMLKNRDLGIIDSFGIINTDVAKKEKFLCTDLVGKNNPASLYKKHFNSLI